VAPVRHPADVVLKFVALAATAFCLFWLVKLYFVTTSARSIDIVADAVVVTLKGLTLGVVILIGALVARAIVTRRRTRAE
jgi:hypothetical protein